MLKLLAKCTVISSSAILDVVMFLGSLGPMLWLGLVLFAHSEIACKMSLVMSVVEGVNEKTPRGGVNRCKC